MGENNVGVAVAFWGVGIWRDIGGVDVGITEAFEQSDGKGFDGGFGEIRHSRDLLSIAADLFGCIR